MAKQQKFTLSEAKKLPRSMLLRIIQKAKNFLKKDDTWISICKEYDEDPAIIDFIPTMFGNLDVSAKTVKGIVILNYKLLAQDDMMATLCQYMIHEYTHSAFQQTMGTKPTKSSEGDNYLHNEQEQEAFSNQISFISDHLGKDEAKEYTENLLDYHEVEEKKERTELKDELLSKA